MSGLDRLRLSRLFKVDESAIKRKHRSSIHFSYFIEPIFEIFELLIFKHCANHDDLFATDTSQVHYKHISYLFFLIPDNIRKSSF